MSLKVTFKDDRPGSVLTHRFAFPKEAATFEYSVKEADDMDGELKEHFGVMRGVAEWPDPAVKDLPMLPLSVICEHLGFPPLTESRKEFAATVKRIGKLERQYQYAVIAVQASGWHPIGDHYFILPIPPDDRFGVLHLPVKKDKLIGATTPLMNQTTDVMRGLVLAVGPGAWLPGKTAFCLPAVGVAEIVLYGRFAGQGASIMARAGLGGDFAERGVNTLLAGLDIKVLAECDILGVVE